MIRTPRSATWEAAGLETPQAEAIVRTLAKADATLATKADLEPIKAEIRWLRSEMRWMTGFLAALILAMAGRLFGVI